MSRLRFGWHGIWEHYYSFLYDLSVDTEKKERYLKKIIYHKGKVLSAN